MSSTTCSCFTPECFRNTVYKRGIYFRTISNICEPIFFHGPFFKTCALCCGRRDRRYIVIPGGRIAMFMCARTRNTKLRDRVDALRSNETTREDEMIIHVLVASSSLTLTQTYLVGVDWNHQDQHLQNVELLHKCAPWYNSRGVMRTSTSNIGNCGRARIGQRRFFADRVWVRWKDQVKCMIRVQRHLG